MVNDPTNPAIGDLSINATALAPFIVDLKPRALLGIRRAQPGFEDAIKEILDNHAALGKRAGITDDEAAELATGNEHLREIKRFLAPARKLVELLEETEGSIEDRQNQIINTSAVSVDQRAKKSENEDLLAKYDLTRKYRSAVAEKAAKTRRRNARAELAAKGTDPAHDAE